MKFNKEAIFLRYKEFSETFIDNETGKTIDVEEETYYDYNDILNESSPDEYNPIKFFILVADYLKGHKADYKLITSNYEEKNEMTLYTTIPSGKFVEIKRASHFTPIDIFNIIYAIDAQKYFSELFLCFENNENEERTDKIYSNGTPSMPKDWINDLLILFKNGELDKYTSVTITEDFDYLGIKEKRGNVELNRLYVKFK